MRATLTEMGPQSRNPLAAGNRFAFIDGLRGLASLAVIVVHFYRADPFFPFLEPSMPAAVHQLLIHCYAGVQVFFVLSGFVIAYTLLNARATPTYVGNFALRRSLRLDPPYWAAMGLEILAIVAIGSAGNVDVHPPTMKTVLVNVLYVQMLTGVPGVLAVSWTLCYEVQFYLVLVLAIGLGQWLAKAWRQSEVFESSNRKRRETGITLAILSLLAAYSLLLASGMLPPAIYGLFVDRWHMFFLGVLACWVLDKRLAAGWFWGFLALCGVAARGELAFETAVAVTTAAVILIAGRTNKLQVWLRHRPLQFVGKISYSMYLLHVTVGIRVLKLGGRLFGVSTAGAVISFALAFAICVAASWGLYFFVERLGLRWAKRFKRRDEKVPLTLASTASTMPVAS